MMSDIREIVNFIRNDPVINPLIGTGFATICTSIENIWIRLTSIDSILKTVRKDIHSHHSNLAISPSKFKNNTLNDNTYNTNRISNIENNLHFTYFWAVTILDQILNIPDVHKDVNVKMRFSVEHKEYKNVLKMFTTLSRDEQINYTHKSMNSVIDLITSLVKQYITITWEQQLADFRKMRELVEKELSTYRLELDNMTHDMVEVKRNFSSPRITTSDITGDSSAHNNDVIFWNNLKCLRSIAMHAMGELHNIHLIGVSVMHAYPYYHIRNKHDDPNYNDTLFHDIIHVNVSSILIDIISYKKRVDMSPYVIFKMSDGERVIEIQWNDSNTLMIMMNGKQIRDLTFPAIEKGIYIMDIRLSYKRNINAEKYDEVVSIHNHQFVRNLADDKYIKVSSEVIKMNHSNSNLYELIDVGYSYVYDTYNVLSLFGLDELSITEGIENLLLFNSLSKCVNDPIDHSEKFLGITPIPVNQMDEVQNGISNVVQIMRNENVLQQGNAHKAKGILELDSNAKAIIPDPSYAFGRRKYVGNAIFTIDVGSRGFISTASANDYNVSVKLDFDHKDTYESKLFGTEYKMNFKNSNGVINSDYQSIMVGEMNVNVAIDNTSTLCWYYRTGTKYTNIFAKSRFDSTFGDPLAMLTYGFKHDTEHILVCEYHINDILVDYNNYILFGFPTLGPSVVKGNLTLTVSHVNLSGGSYGDSTSIIEYTDFTYKGRKWNAGKSNFKIHEMFRSFKHMAGWIVPLIKVTNKDIKKFDPQMEFVTPKVYVNASLNLKYIYNADEDEAYGITNEDYQNISIKNPSKLILSRFGIWYAGDLLSISFSADNVVVDYIYNPLNVVSHSVTNYDVSDTMKRNSDVIMLVRSLQYDVKHVQDELYYIKRLINDMNKPNLMMAFTNLLWLSNSLTPLVSIIMSGVMLSESIIDTVTHEHLTYERTVESVLYFIHLLIAVRNAKGLNITNFRISPVIIKSLSQHIYNFRNCISKINVRTFPHLNGYSKLVEISPTSLNMTVNCHWRKLSADGNITRKYYNLVEKYSDNIITPLERIHLKSLEKMRIVPLHEYISIRTHKEIDGKEYLMFTVYGVSDGNALPTNGALFGRNNTKTLLSLPADTAGIWKTRFSRNKESNDEWSICSWKDSQMTKADILQAASYDMNKEVSNMKLQEIYESISYNLLNFNKSVVSRSENIMISEAQLKALDNLILESRHGYQYRLIGNNCQVLSNDIINLMKDPRKKPHWVTEKQYSDYVSTLYESFT